MLVKVVNNLIDRINKAEQHKFVYVAGYIDVISGANIYSANVFWHESNAIDYSKKLNNHFKGYKAIVKKRKVISEKLEKINDK